MLRLETYRGHIRNWQALSQELNVNVSGLSREEREQELLLKAYETWGEAMPEHLYGMFALAIWDEEKQELFCLRDQFGTKPFYYYLTENGKLFGTFFHRKDLLKN